MEKESLLQNKRVYIAIPKRLYDDKIVSRAIRYLHSLKPLVLDDPRGMFKDNEQWAKSFPNYLEQYDAVVVVTDDCFIGKGTYKELWYFVHKNLPRYQYIERNKYQAISRLTGIHIVNWNNWIDYARTEYE